jgi:hypothetical protein
MLSEVLSSEVAIMLNILKKKISNKMKKSC